MTERLAGPVTGEPFAVSGNCIGICIVTLTAIGIIFDGGAMVHSLKYAVNSYSSDMGWQAKS
jgi:hypothetical protein